MARILERGSNIYKVEVLGDELSSIGRRRPRVSEMWAASAEVHAVASSLVGVPTRTMAHQLTIVPIVSMPFEENSYIVRRPERSDCLVIDPGLEPHLILEVLEREKLTPAMILNTHGHGDHIGGNAAMKEAYPEAPLVIGEGDVGMLSDPVRNLGSLAGVALISPPADRTVREGDTISAAGIRLQVLETPGHTPGHVVFVCSECVPPTVFGGDVLFAGGIGRFDLPGGNGPQLLAGIRNKLFTLPDETAVYPGHGPPTTIGEERRSNPFVGEGAGFFGLG